MSHGYCSHTRICFTPTRVMWPQLDHCTCHGLTKYSLTLHAHNMSNAFSLPMICPAQVSEQTLSIICNPIQSLTVTVCKVCSKGMTLQYLKAKLSIQLHPKFSLKLEFESMVESIIEMRLRLLWAALTYCFSYPAVELGSNDILESEQSTSRTMLCKSRLFQSLDRPFTTLLCDCVLHALSGLPWCAYAPEWQVRSSCTTLNVSFACVPYERRAGDGFKRALQLTPSLSRLQSQSSPWRPSKQLETHEHCTVDRSLQITNQ